MPVANIDRSIVAGVQAELSQTWQQVVPAFRKQQELLMRPLSENKIRNAQWAWKESTPFPEYWPYSGDRTIQGFRDRFISMGKHNFSAAIRWNRFDEEDDLLDDLRPHVHTLVNRYAQLPDVLMSEYFNGAAVELPQLRLCYDGASVFSNLDGSGNARLGATGGNIIDGSGLTVSGVIHDLAIAQRRFLEFVDPTAGKPIFSVEDVAFEKLHVIGPNSANEVFQKAAESEYIKLDITNMVSESNYVKGKFSWHINPYFTDSSDWYVCAENPYWKAFVWREPSAPETKEANQDNSDHARNTGENAIYTHVRTDIGPWFPGVIIKVDG